MFKNKIQACAFFSILTLLWSAYAADEEDYSKYTTPSKNAHNSSFGQPRDFESSPHLAGSESEIPRQLFEDTGSSMERSQNHSIEERQRDLENLFTPAARVQVPETARQVVSGVASLMPLFPTGQIFVPTALIGLNSLGLTKYIIPDVGWESWALVGGIAIPIAVAALISTYNGASQFFKPTSKDLNKTQERVFEQNYSWWESASRSYPTQFVQLALWGGLFFALLMNTESRVTGWGDYRILGGIFGTLALIPIYFIFVRATNDINKYTYRRYTNKHDEGIERACLSPLEEAKEKIKDCGLTEEVRELGMSLNVIERPFSMATVNSQNDLEQVRSDDSSILLPNPEDSEFSRDIMLPRNAGSSIHSVQMSDLIKPKYVKIFEQTMNLSRTIPSWIKGWNSWSTTISKYLSRGVQVLSIPAEELIAYALSYSLLSYLNAPSGISIGASVVVAAAYGISLPFKSIKENGLIWREYEQWLRLFKPQVTCGYFGERIAPVTARALTLLYITFPVTDFIRRSLFEQAIGITNVPAQIVILAPFMAGAGFAAPAQFLDSAYTTFANWVATGGRVTLPAFGSDSNYSFKLFCLCCSCDDNRQFAIDIVERLNEIEGNTVKLSTQFRKILATDLGINIASGDDSPLLDNVGSNSSNLHL